MSLTSGKQLILTSGAAGGGGYAVSRSLRFNSSDSAYLSRTPASAGNRKTWTWAGWVKKSALGTDQALFSVPQGGGYPNTGIVFNGSNQLRVFAADASTNTFAERVTSAVYRDTSAWMHIVVAADYANTQLKIYVNGSEVTAFATSTGPTNTDGLVNASGVTHIIGQFSNTWYFSGYLADIHFIDGQALTPTSFGEFSATTGVWVPKAYTGSYGTNGFRLDFADNSSNTATTLGKDTSGNGNNWTPNNLVTYLGGITTGSLGGTFSGATLGSLASLLDQSIGTGWGGQVLANGQTVTVSINFSGVSNVTSLRLYGYFRSGQSGQVSVNSGAYQGYTTATDDGWVTLTSQLSGSTLLTRIDYRMTHAIGGTEQCRVYAVEVNGVIIGSASSSDIDSLVDVPTNGSEVDTGLGGQVRGNYCTLNALTNGGTLANGNLDFSTGASHALAKSTFAIPASGLWYAEATVTTLTSGSVAAGFGLGTAALSLTAVASSAAGAWEIYASDARYFNRNGTQTNIAGTFAAGAILQLAVDPANSRAWVGVDNTWYDGSNGTTGNPGAGSNPTFTSLPADLFVIANTFSNTLSINFGQRAFAYTAPSGFKALCTQNLPAPLVTKSSTVFDVITYTGTGSSLTLPNGSSTPTSIAFTPDFVWLKGRSGATDHAIYDSVRDVQKDLVSNSTAAETTQTTGLTAFGTNTFTVGSLAKLNTSSATYVTWCWDAGTSTVANPDGSITSQVRANPTAGFSVVSVPGYTYPTKTAGHGLGVEPHFIITKSRGVSNPWIIYHKSAGANTYFQFDTGAGYTGVAGVWSGVTSTVFPLNSGVNQQTDIVAYCFAPVVGYSGFGSYVGNGSSDGVFVFTGFRSRYIMIKRSSGIGDWVIYDSVRLTYNASNVELYANSSGAEVVDDPIDILSNGFKIRTTGSGVNSSGNTYVFAAFAESPFNYSRAR
jgi:hypothetical protein